MGFVPRLRTANSGRYTLVSNHDEASAASKEASRKYLAYMLIGFLPELTGCGLTSLHLGEVDVTADPGSGKPVIEQPMEDEEKKDPNPLPGKDVASP